LIEACKAEGGISPERSCRVLVFFRCAAGAREAPKNLGRLPSCRPSCRAGPHRGLAKAAPANAPSPCPGAQILLALARSTVVNSQSVAYTLPVTEEHALP